MLLLMDIENGDYMYIILNENNYITEFDTVNYLENSISVTENIPDDFIYNYNKYKYIDNDFVFDDTYYNSIILNNIKHTKLKQISKDCEQTIINGIDCETTLGLEHFSLTEKDQINLSSCYNMGLQGINKILYHSDGNLCRYFSQDEINNIMNNAIKFKIYHTTYYNHLNIWIKRCENIEDVKNIYYGCELPIDLKNHMEEILNDKN